MGGFSEVFSHSLYKDFPQKKGKLSVNQEEKIQKVAERVMFTPPQFGQEIKGHLALVSTLLSSVKTVESKLECKNKKSFIFFISYSFHLFIECFIKKGWYLSDIMIKDILNLLFRVIESIDLYAFQANI